MILLYITNRDLRDFGGISEPVSYRNPRYFDGIEKAEKVYVFGDHKAVIEAYKKAKIKKCHI